MNRLNKPQLSRSRWLRRCGALSLLAAGLTLQGCNAGAPKGQVVAVVNGQEITYQDLSAEARAGRVQHADPKALLQKVLGRVLLAQDGHSRGLDRYPGYPSDIARLQQTFLAERVVQTRIKPPTASPSADDVRAFMLAHPFIFANRMRVELDELHYQNGAGVKGLEQMSDLTEVTTRLKELSVPFDRQTHTVDTADLPAALAQRFTSSAPGQLTFIKTPTDSIAMVVKGRTAVNMPDDQAQALAVRLMGQADTQKQIATMLTGLEARAKITYQKGFAPTPPGAQPAGAAKAS